MRCGASDQPGTTHGSPTHHTACTASASLPVHGTSDGIMHAICSHSCRTGLYILVRHSGFCVVSLSALSAPRSCSVHGAQWHGVSLPFHGKVFVASHHGVSSDSYGGQWLRQQHRRCVARAQSSSGHISACSGLCVTGEGTQPAAACQQVPLWNLRDTHLHPPTCAAPPSSRKPGGRTQRRTGR